MQQIQESTELLSPTPGLPTYTEARHFLRILDGVRYDLFRGLYNEVLAQRGSPQEQEDWTDPDSWIPARLSDDEQALALRIWRESRGVVNPRYLRGLWFLAIKHQLMVRDVENKLHRTQTGDQFLAEPDGEVVAEIDAREGVLEILRIVAERGPGKRSDLLPGYGEYCRTYTTYRSEGVIKGSLYDRLVNLIERGLVVRSGATYEITEKGLTHLEKYKGLLVGKHRDDRQSQLHRLTKEITDEARHTLIEHLGRMDPYRFEALIKLLLEEMGYTQVETTSPATTKVWTWCRILSWASARCGKWCRSRDTEAISTAKCSMSCAAASTGSMRCGARSSRRVVSPAAPSRLLLSAGRRPLH
jgi:restriction system protein